MLFRRSGALMCVQFSDNSNPIIYSFETTQINGGKGFQMERIFAVVI